MYVVGCFICRVVGVLFPSAELLGVAVLHKYKKIMDHILIPGVRTLKISLKLLTSSFKHIDRLNFDV